MAAPIVCSRCGFANQPGWTFCTNCGTPLTSAGTPGPAVAPSVPPPVPPFYGPPPYGPPAVPYPMVAGYPPYGYGAPPWEAERQKQIGRTKTGVLLLLVGSLISWIPIIGGFVGGLLTLIGAILVILGRKAFGPTHRRNVAISIVLFLVGIGIIVVGAIIAIFEGVGVSATSSEAELAAALTTAFTNILIITAVGAFVYGLTGVFFTYALQKKEGRILLWAAYGATVGIQIAIVILTLPAIPGIAASVAHEIATTGRVDSSAISNAVTGATAGLSLLSVIPAMLYAAANYLAYARINKGEIPPPATPPPTPTFGSPPAPPMNPM